MPPPHGDLHGGDKKTFDKEENKDDANYGWNPTPAAGDDLSVVIAGIRHRF